MLTHVYAFFRKDTANLILGIEQQQRHNVPVEHRRVRIKDFLDELEQRIEADQSKLVRLKAPQHGLVTLSLRDVILQAPTQQEIFLVEVFAQRLRRLRRPSTEWAIMLA